MSMLRWLADTSSPVDIVFINNIRTPADVIFDDELRYLSTRLGSHLRLGIVPGAVQSGQAWNGPVCHFSKDLVRMWAPDYLDREVFVCGPGGYMDHVRDTLTQMGFPSQRYHQESFGGAAPTQKAAGPAGAAGSAVAPPVPSVVPARVAAPVPLAPVAGTDDSKVELVFSVSSKTVMVTSNDLILDVAEEHGIVLANSCRAGNCGTCKIRKTEGTVEMDDQQALGESDLMEGFVLACVGRACGPRVVLEA
jgi:ferredoxin-NADP reductase